MIFFGSDNNSGAHPRILEALERANSSSFSSYGEDPFTEEAEKEFKKIFGPEAGIFPVFLGTGANVVGLKAMTAPYEAIICAESAHINTDECGAPESAIGCKLYTLPHEHGKITPEQCLPLLERRSAVTHSYPITLSITQSTEFGTLYTLEELKAFGEFCKRHELFLHMDGARICNAAAAMGLSPAALSTELGVDMLSFGGTKNGLLFGEAVITLNPRFKRALPYLRKQSCQLMSKMRFISAQFVEYLKDGLWRENALHANEMAALLRAELENLPGLTLTRPTQVNAVFARLPRKAIGELHKNFYFYIWDENDAPGGPKDWPEVRWMTSFNTSEDDVARFAGAIKKLAR